MVRPWPYLPYRLLRGWRVALSLMLLARLLQSCTSQFICQWENVSGGVLIRLKHLLHSSAVRYSETFHSPYRGVDPGFEIGGCPKCACKRAKFFFSATLTFKSTTRFGHLGIVTLSLQLASTSMKRLKIITILRLFVATDVSISDARTRRLFSAYPLNTSSCFQIDFLG